MAVASNYMWIPANDSSSLGMYAGSALASVIVPADHWKVAFGDESDAFTSVEVPPWMQLWAACPSLRVGGVRGLLPPELASFPSGTWIFWTWSRLLEYLSGKLTEVRTPVVGSSSSDDEEGEEPSNMIYNHIK